MAVISRADFRGLQRAVTSVALLSKPGTANKLTRAGVSQAAKYVNKVMKTKAQKGIGPTGGSLRKSLGQKVKTYRYTSTTVAIIGPRTNWIRSFRGKRIRPSKYSHIEESGRRAQTPSKKRALSDRANFIAKKNKAYAGHPYIAPTLQATHSQAEKLAAKGILAAIAKELLKGRK